MTIRFQTAAVRGSALALAFVVGGACGGDNDDTTGGERPADGAAVDSGAGGGRPSASSDSGAGGATSPPLAPPIPNDRRDAPGATRDAEARFDVRPEPEPRADTGPPSNLDAGTLPPVRRDAGGGSPDATPPPDPGAPSGCSVTKEGGSGKEAGGAIPICCTPSSADKALIDEAFKLLNEHRAANGLPALAYDAKLEQAIQGHAQHMATHTFFSHDAPEASVSSPWTRAELCGTKASGENIAQGQRGAAQVMESWKNSAGHNANMLNRTFKRVGIGQSKLFWGQLFGT